MAKTSPVSLAWECILEQKDRDVCPYCGIPARGAASLKRRVHGENDRIIVRGVFRCRAFRCDKAFVISVEMPTSEFESFYFHKEQS